MKKIRYYKFIKLEKIAMNCKLEKFWNSSKYLELSVGVSMNCKLEKFWNEEINEQKILPVKWTVNLKSFEMDYLMKLSNFLKHEL